MLPTHRRPTTPGEILCEEFLAPKGMSQTALADLLGLHVQQVNRIARDHCAITAPIALKLAKAFNMSPEFWMTLQMQVDLWDAREASKARPVSRSRKTADSGGRPRRKSTMTHAG